MSLHSDTLFWFRANQSSLAAKQVRKTRQNSYIWILYFRQCIYIVYFFSPSFHSSENIFLEKTHTPPQVKWSFPCIHQISTRVDAYKYSFLPRTIVTWNFLPQFWFIWPSCFRGEDLLLPGMEWTRLRVGWNSSAWWVNSSIYGRSSVKIAHFVSTR
jgi:hypothetical protein